MNEQCTDMQRLISTIRQYLSSENKSFEFPINGVFEVERSVENFHSYNDSFDLDDKILRDLLCIEALRIGLVLHFGKEK